MHTPPLPGRFGLKREVEMKVLIAGCGDVGTALGLQLVRRGHTVWGLRRRVDLLPPEILPIALDLVHDPLPGRIPSVDRVVYAAAADQGTEDAYRAAYVDGPGRLLDFMEAAETPRPDRFLFVSSTAVYGSTGGEWVDEDSPCHPDGFRGSTVLEGERRVWSSPIPGVVLRLGGIYGPGRTRMLDLVRSGRARCPHGPPVWTNRIHRDDCAGALAHLLEHPRPEPLYLGVDHEPTPLCDLYRELAEMLGVPAPGIDPEPSRDRSNKRVSSLRLRESGYQFRFPTFREGYRQLLEAEP
jgi:nucleoside-diphosphate-sugar epimerase